MKYQWSIFKNIQLFLFIGIFTVGLCTVVQAQAPGTFNVAIDSIVQTQDAIGATNPKRGNRRVTNTGLSLSGTLNCQKNQDCVTNGLDGSLVTIQQDLNVLINQRQEGTRDLNGKSTGTFLLNNQTYSFESRINGVGDCQKNQCLFALTIIGQKASYGSLILNLDVTLTLNKKGDITWTGASGQGEIFFNDPDVAYAGTECPLSYDNQVLNSTDWTNFGPYHVHAGKSLNVILQPDGDHPTYPLLHVKEGNVPTTVDWDCRPYETGISTKNNELCSLAGPGDFYIGVNAQKGGTLNFDLDVSGCQDPACPYQTGCQTQQCPFASNDASIGFNDWHDYGPFEVKPGQELNVNLIPLSGNADLHVMKDNWPTMLQWDCKSDNTEGVNDSCLLTEPGTYYVSVFGYLGKDIRYHLDVGGCSNSLDVDASAGNTDDVEIAVVLFDCLDDSNKQSPEEIASYMFSKDLSATSPYRNSISNYFEKISNGDVNITGDVYGWYNQFCAPDNCFKTFEDALGQLESSETNIDFSQYDGFLFYYNVDALLCRSNGSANFGKKSIVTSKGTVDAYVANVYVKGSTNKFRTNNLNTNTSNDVVAHELSHAIAQINHPAGLSCNDQILTDSPENDCDLKGSWDQFSLMSNLRLDLQASQPGSAPKEMVGWLDPDQIQTVTSSGEYTIGNYDEPNSGKPMALKIPLKKPILIPDGSGFIANYLYIEYRGMTDLDWRSDGVRNIIQKDLSYYLIPNVHGALIRAVDCQTKPECWTFLLDTTPLSHDPYRPQAQFGDAQLGLNKVFVEPVNNIRIETIEINEGVDITVSIQL